VLSDKQKIDDDVTTLKLLSRDFDTPVIVISSLNRQNYNAPIDYQAFKESGGIEYSCDVVIGLQYKGTGTKGFDFHTARAANPREIELVTLKNRNGAIGAPIDYKYYPAYYYFEEQNSAFSDFGV
jgi:replicative DNA helicase